MIRLRLAPAVLAFALTASAIPAVEPGEMLADPALETRARDLSRGLRCLVCRNESIDDSDAALARDLRILLRARLLAGDTDTEAVAFIVDRYGEYVLLSPRPNGSALLVWLAGPAMLLAGGVAAYITLRRRAVAQPTEILNEHEETQLSLLRDHKQ